MPPLRVICFEYNDPYQSVAKIPFVRKFSTSDGGILKDMGILELHLNKFRYSYVEAANTRSDECQVMQWRSFAMVRTLHLEQSAFMLLRSIAC